MQLWPVLVEGITAFGTSHIALGDDMAGIMRTPAHHAKPPLQQDAGVVIVLLCDQSHTVGKSQCGIKIGKGKDFFYAGQLPCGIFTAMPTAGVCSVHAAW